VPPEIVTNLIRVLSGGPLSAAAAGLALGMSKSAAHRHLVALNQAGVVEKAQSAGRSAGWQLASRRPAPPQYTTLEDLAEAVHQGLVEADDDARSVMEEVRRIAARPRLTLLQGGGDGGQ
jgi:predicted ArsR family transcriptional regulator